MNDSRFNPDMLILARESRGMTQTDLAALISVKQGTISKLESGMLLPHPEMVDSISGVLKYPPHFFGQPDKVYGFNSTVFFHRKRQSLADRILRSLHAQMNITRMRVGRLLRSVPLDTSRQFRPMTASEYEGGAPSVARLIRASWQLPRGPIPSVIESIEGAGGIVVPFDFGTRQADAISEWIHGFPPIFLVNTNFEIPGDRFRLTLAHELGHIILHETPNPKMEDEASSFAAEFLMPRREIKGSLFGLNMAKLAANKRYWKVSMQALIQRAYELKTVTESQRKYLIINLMKRCGTRIHEPLESEIPREQPRLFEQIMRQHIDDLGYTIQQLASFLFFTDEQELSGQYLGERKLRVVN